MPNVIKIKYSQATDTPPSLERGEIAYSETSKNFFIGESDGAVVKLMGVNDLTKLNGIEANANNYIHPTTAGNKHIPAGGSAGQVLKWSADGTAEWGNVEASLQLGETQDTAYRGDRGKIAYDHSQSQHAPVDAQKNSDITKAEIEAKLTGVITSHSHNVTKSDVGLGNVDNTADADKNVNSATKLSTARSIAGVAFDGTQDIAIPIANLIKDANNRVVTDSEKSNWNEVYSWYQTMTQEDQDNVINTIKEILDAFANASEDLNIASELTNPTNMTLDGGSF